MKSLEVLWYEISIACIKVCLVILPFLLIKQDYPAILGLLLGTAASLINFYWLVGSVKRSIKRNPGAASSFTYSRYGSRLAFSALVLTGAMFIDGVNFFWTVGGLLMPKVVIVGGQLFPAFKESVLRFSRKAG
ncbi:MAG: hypothetical protein CVU88_01160 [Firmicutes bacterium HGW-Firmicutes-13]|nr:MAG: hypothetical protein CVU88_01160 [Firmicutes bacterium HGW-Firmicutes-13]